MEKKTKRIGLFSMGLLLIFVGVFILLSQFTRLDIVGLSFKLWPVILIILGVEVLWMNHKNNMDGGFSIRFDLASIFIVIIILMVNVGIYVVFEIGAIDFLKRETRLQDFVFNMNEDLGLDPSIDKIVIEGTRGQDLDVRMVGGDVFNYRQTRHGMEETQNLADKKFKEEAISIREMDNTLYFTINEFKGYENHISSLTLNIPLNREVEFMGGKDMNLTVDGLKAGIIIDGYRNVSMKIKENTSVEVLADVEKKEKLAGNINWKIEKITNNQGNDEFKGAYVFGGGNRKIRIVNLRENIKVNKI